MSENKDANERLFADVEKLVDAAVAREDITIQQGADISQALWHCLVGQPQPPVPTGSVEVTREHREAAYKAAYGDEPPDDGDDEWVATGLYRGAALTGERLGAPNQANAFAQLLATREAAAHQAGRESAQAAGAAGIALSSRDSQLCREWLDARLDDMFTAQDDGDQLLVRALKALYAELGRESAQGGWVAVTERLPMVGEDVLMVSREGFLTSGGWDGDDWYYGDTLANRGSITHWMPLPPNPPSDPSKGGR